MSCLKNRLMADLVMISGQHDHWAGPPISAKCLQGCVERLHWQRSPDVPEVTQENDASVPEGGETRGRKK